MVVVVPKKAVAAAAGAVVVAAKAAGAAGARDKQRLMEKHPMKRKSNMTTSLKILTSAILVSGFVALALHPALAAKTDAAAALQIKQKEFDTPQQAADSLVQAAESFDMPVLKEILGPDSGELIASQDPVTDKNRAASFAAKAKEKNSIATDARNPDRAILTIGNDDFPFPIPIVKQNGKWYFDTKEGRQEILNRRVGANELDAIAVCRGFVEAQQEYAQQKHDDSKVNQYAQRIISTPGKHDGLAWQNPDGTWGGPVGEHIAKALEQGYSNPSQPQPYHGYYFKVLKGQGPAGPLGEMDFVVKGAMIGGFALAAAPAQYRVTGVQTFIVGPDGVVYQKDLGADTLKTFQSMDKYNPDKTWTVTEDDVQQDQDSESQAQ